jgi:RNA methyltransferase, TrmH family
MLSKNNIKLIKSLAQQKNRAETGLFVVEGDKIVSELLASEFPVRHIYCTQKWEHHLIGSSVAYTLITDQELERISQQKSPNQVLAVAEILDYQFSSPEIPNDFLVLLDDVQDPGNLGTFLRVCNWYGFNQVFCSENTVDCFNPKVIQASMGAIFRVKVFYRDLESLIREYRESFTLPICGAMLEGIPVHKFDFSEGGLIILGNESRGISEEVRSMLTHRITIPSYPAEKRDMESLNVATAGAIILHEIRRSQSQ